MGRQRNNPQSKIKEESPEKELNEIEASNLSAIQFEIVIIRMLKDLSENFNKLYICLLYTSDAADEQYIV